MISTHGQARPPVVVLGAGLAGLTAARELRRRSVPVRVFEAGKQIAGLAASFRDEDGFVHDFGAHFITNRLAAAIGVGSRCRDVKHYGETVLLKGRYYPYPFGLLRNPRFLASALASRSIRRSAPPESAGEWYVANYGRALAEEVAIPLLESWSGAPASELATSVVPPQIDRGNAHVLRLKLASWLSGRAVANGYSRAKPESAHVWHVYPEGSLGTLCEHLAADLDGVIQTESPVEAILVEDGRAVGVQVKGEMIEASAVVSTAPVHVLAKLVRGTDAVAHFARFRYRPLLLVNIRMHGRGLLGDVVTWTPERHLPFFRITEAPVSMPWLAPDGKTTLTVDIGSETDEALWRMPEDQLAELCVEHLQSFIPDAKRRFISARVLRTTIAHPIYLRAYERDRLQLEQGLPVRGLYSIGRNGAFAHILMEDVYWRTLAQMRQLVAELSGPANTRAEAPAPAVVM
jgi:oxygen-dependent protoporphyrinogen oxidase